MEKMATGVGDIEAAGGEDIGFIISALFKMAVNYKSKYINYISIVYE